MPESRRSQQLQLSLRLPRDVHLLRELHAQLLHVHTRLLLNALKLRVECLHGYQRRGGTSVTVGDVVSHARTSEKPTRDPSSHGAGRDAAVHHPRRRCFPAHHCCGSTHLNSVVLCSQRGRSGRPSLAEFSHQLLLTARLPHNGTLLLRYLSTKVAHVPTCSFGAVGSRGRGAVRCHGRK